MLSEFKALLPCPNNNYMKPPHVSSIPHLLDVDPAAPFEFYYEYQEPWWDEYDTLDSDFSDDDQLPSIHIKQPNFVSISPTVSAIHAMEETESKDDENEDKFVSKIISTISLNAPKAIYHKKKSAMRRRRKRRQRKRISSSAVDPEFQKLWSNVGDLFAPPCQPVKTDTPHTQSNLPTVNLFEINKNMLKRFDVVNLPIHSCSPDPEFYRRPEQLDFRGYKELGSSKHMSVNPFGHLPGIHTQLGPVALPQEPFFGHVWHDNKWIVAAEYPAPSDPGGGGHDPPHGHRPGREGGRRGQDGGRGQGAGERGRVAVLPYAR